MTNESTRDVGQHPFTGQSNESTPDNSTYRNTAWMRNNENANENPGNETNHRSKERNSHNISGQMRDHSFRFFSSSSKNLTRSPNEEKRVSYSERQTRNLSPGSSPHYLGSPERYINRESNIEDEDQSEGIANSERGEQKFFETTSSNIDKLLMEFKKELDTIKTMSDNANIDHTSRVKVKQSRSTQQQFVEILQSDLESPSDEGKEISSFDLVKNESKRPSEWKSFKDLGNSNQFFNFRTSDTQDSSGINNSYSQEQHTTGHSIYNIPGAEHRNNLTVEQQRLDKKGLVQRISDTNLYRMSTSNHFQSPNTFVKTINEISTSTVGRPEEKQRIDLFDSEEYYDDNDDDDSTRTDHLRFNFATPVSRFDKSASLDLERFRSTVESRASQKIEQFDNMSRRKSKDSPSLKSLLKTPTKTDSPLGFALVNHGSSNSEHVERLSLENNSLKNEVGRLAAQVTSLNTRVEGLEQQFENVLTMLKGRI